MTPEVEALIEAAAGMNVDELSNTLAADPRISDPRTLAAYLITMAG